MTPSDRLRAGRRAPGRLLPRLVACAGAACLVVLAAGCDRAGSQAKTRASAAAAPAPQTDPLSIAIPPEMAQRVRVGPLPVGDSVDVLRIPGRFDKNLNRTARIGAPVTGRVLHVRVALGQNVRAGEAMAEISSQELATAQLAFLKAASAEQLQTRAVERAQLLLASDVIGSAELQRRENELAVARAEKRAAFDQLRTVGLSVRAIAEIERTGHINSTLPVAATRAGTVVERLVAEGQVVQPADALFVVSDLSSVWAVADVPEQEAARVRPDQRVEIEVPALDDELIQGSIVYIADVVNPETRTVRVGVVVDNPQRQLKPAMLLTMRIEARRARRALVPASAVVREQDHDHVFVVDDQGRATLRQVRLGPERGGARALLEPLAPDARIVLDGAFHLNNERQRRNLEGGQAVVAAGDKAGGK